MKHEYKVGDKVKVMHRSEWDGWVSERMDKLVGKTLTVLSLEPIAPGTHGPFVRLNTGDGDWWSFPASCLEPVVETQPVGDMALRDYFAGQALAGWAADGQLKIQVGHKAPFGSTANFAYQVADAMLAARASTH